MYQHRLHTSYEHVNYATTEQLLSELSGGVPLQLNLNDYTSNLHALTDELADLTTRMCIVTAYNDGSVRSDYFSSTKLSLLQLEISSEYSIQRQTYYTVLAVDQVSGKSHKAIIIQSVMKVELLNSRKVSLIRLRCGPGTVAVTGPWTTLDNDAWHDVKSIADSIQDAQAPNVFWLLLFSSFGVNEMLHFQVASYNIYFNVHQLVNGFLRRGHVRQ